MSVPGYGADCPRMVVRFGARFTIVGWLQGLAWEKMCDDSWAREKVLDDSALSLILRKYISICGFLRNAKMNKQVKLPED